MISFSLPCIFWPLKLVLRCDLYVIFWKQKNPVLVIMSLETTRGHCISIVADRNAEKEALSSAELFQSLLLLSIPY